MNDQKKGIFFIGKSSSGKDTFYQKTLEKFQIERVTPYTTRPKRPGEIEGKEYYFITEQKMKLLERKEQLLETRTYKTSKGIWTYATGKEHFNLEENNYLNIITWQGYEQFLRFYSREQLIPFYITMDDGLRLERAINREIETENNNFAELCRRFLADSEDFKPEYIMKHKPYIINNDGDIKNTQEQIDDILIHKLHIPLK